MKRFGWYVPDADGGASVSDHWRSLRNPNVARIFDLDPGEMRRLAPFTRDNQTAK